MNELTVEELFERIEEKVKETINEADFLLSPQKKKLRELLSKALDESREGTYEVQKEGEN